MGRFERWEGRDPGQEGSPEWEDLYSIGGFDLHLQLFYSILLSAGITRS